MRHSVSIKYTNISLNIFRFINTDLWKSALTYDVLKQIEEYWSKKLQYDNLFDKNDLKNKFYVLSMFPYPSGKLHVGHVRVYTISDTIARFYRMTGKNVFQPMGWDSFGLPAENAALEHGIPPSEWTQKNICDMKAQFKKLLCTFDWESEVRTSSPEYYRWTQYIFLKMFDAGLVYQKQALVNWDPVDETVLADEQVDEKGLSWRSRAKIERRLLKQWFIRTTKFSRDLYEGLNKDIFCMWKDIVDIQKNWIGKCNGFSFDLKVESPDGITDTNVLNIWVEDLTDILNAEFIYTQPNSLLDILAGHIKDTNGKLNLRAVNPFTGSTLPIYVTKHASYPFGRDTHIGIPSKSKFDFDFATKVSIQQLSDKSIGLTQDEICNTALKMRIGGYPVSSNLKDWLISRQRYWGTPIPIVHCNKCGPQPVPYEQLPVFLPPLPKDYKLGKNLNKFLEKSSWRQTTCPRCKGSANRETDTMDTFVDSSWYYLRYSDVNNIREPFNSSIVNQMLPVDLYVGGKEHATLHLYYARFVSYFLHSIGLLEQPEPFKNLLCQGMVKAKTYKTSEGKYLKPNEMQLETNLAVCKATGEKLKITWEKMSKSKYNGIEPNEILDKYGVDSTRLFLLCITDPREHREWNEDLFKYILRWQLRLWLTIKEFLSIRENSLTDTNDFNMEENIEELRKCRNSTVRNVTFYYRDTQTLAEIINELQTFTRFLRRSSHKIQKYSKEYEKSLSQLIIMLTPIAPHFAATLWYGFTAAPHRINIDSDEINWKANVFQQKWPKMDEDFKVPLRVKVNNRATYDVYVQNTIVKTMTTDEALKYAKTHEKVQYLLGRFGPIIAVKVRKYGNECVEINITTEHGN